MNKISSLIFDLLPILIVLPLLLMVGVIIVVDKAHHHPIKTEVTVGPVVIEPVQLAPAPILIEPEAIVIEPVKVVPRHVNDIVPGKKHHHKKSKSPCRIIIGQWKWRLNGTS